MSARSRLAAALAVLLAPAASAELASARQADVTAGARPGDTVRVTPARSYEAGWLHRLLLGDLNRDLWSIPVDAVVLDLSGFAGGLTPTERGGGAQTPQLRFQGADGQEYRFRSLDKDASQGLDPELRRTIVADVLQDQVASLFPLAAMVVDSLLDAAGVLHAEPRLVLMPDDPRLGQFREEFAGRLGWIEVQPNEGEGGAPGFAGSGSVTGTEEFLDELEQTPDNQVNAAAYLRARLVDLFVGDWDRHPDQWRWAAFEDGEGMRWEPVPRDRDWALNRIDGLVMRLGRSRWPQFVGFDDEYGSIFGTVWNARALDRQLLSELTREDFVAASRELQGLLTDDVIGGAVERLPPTYPDTVREELRAALVARRDALLEAALEYYQILAGWVDVWATDEPETGTVERLDGGRVRIALRRQGGEAGSAPAPHFERVLEPSETHELRVFLRGGDDSLTVAGAEPGPIKIRVVGGGGDDRLVDLTTGRDVRFYDDCGTNEIAPAEETIVDTTPYEEPPDVESETHQARPRDWGSRWYSFPLVRADSDIGLSAGQTWEWQEYGFRFYPYRNRLRFTYAVNPVRFGARVSAGWEATLGRTPFAAVADLEGVTRDVRWFYGIGNETPEQGSDDFHRADRAVLSLAAGVRFRPSARFTARLAPVIWHSRGVDRDEPTFVESFGPKATGDALDAVTQVGLLLEAELDRRDVPVVARSGARLRVDARAVPALLDAQDAYLTVGGEASVNVPLGAAPVLSLRAGARHLFGEAPYFELPQLGGRDELRGFREGRFTGRSALYGTVQLRSPITRFFALFPGTLGANALVDLGRVWADGESSDRLHVGYGGGLWVTLVRADLLANVLAVHTREGTRFYLAFEFPY
ncbi:MAG TPA: BamA/TamA family outer membrane protein [Longimicrobiales bacterium]|nr:BamA/TamA family outer membrane protein [Longimicrobiales bacterium]